MALGQLIPDGTTLTSLENVLFASGRKWGGFLYTEARDVFMVAALLMVAWHVVRIGLASGEGQMFSVFSEVLEKLLVIALVSAMFIKGTSFVDYVVTAGNGLATASGGNNAFDAIFGQMGKAIITMWDAWTQMPLWEISDPLSMGAFSKKVVSAVMILIASLLVLIIGAILIFTMLSGSFILAFAMASGPLVWAFALLPPTSFMVNGWLKLLATGFFTKLVAVLCIDMAVSAVTAAIGPSNMPTGAAFWVEPVNIFANLAQMLVLLLLVALLVLFARGMASQLVSGNPSTDLWKSATGAAAAASHFVGRMNSSTGSNSTASKGASRGGGSSASGSSSGSGGATSSGASSGTGGAGASTAASGPPSMNAHNPSSSSSTPPQPTVGATPNRSSGNSQTGTTANLVSSGDTKAAAPQSPLDKESMRANSPSPNSNQPGNSVPTVSAQTSYSSDRALGVEDGAPGTQATRTDVTAPQSPLELGASASANEARPLGGSSGDPVSADSHGNVSPSGHADPQSTNRETVDSSTNGGPPRSVDRQGFRGDVSETSSSAPSDTTGHRATTAEPRATLAKDTPSPTSASNKPDSTK